EEGRAALRESLLRAVGGLHAGTPFDRVVLSGRLLETEPALAAQLEAELARFGGTTRLPGLPGAWVKHAAQGAALLADGLAGASRGSVVEQRQLGGAGGTALDWLRHPRAGEVRRAFGLDG